MAQTRQFLRLLRPRYRPGMSLLDVGCGAGHFKTALDREGFDVDYVGVELEPSFLRIARQVHGPGPKFIHADAHDLHRILRRPFDAVVAYMLLEHLPHYRAPLEALAASTRHHLFLRLLLGPQRHEIKKFENPDDPEDFTFYNVYEEKAVRDDLVRLGFPRVHIEPDDFSEALDLPYRGPNATWTHHGLQIIGNIVLSWRHVVASRNAPMP